MPQARSHLDFYYRRFAPIQRAANLSNIVGVRAVTPSSTNHSIKPWGDYLGGVDASCPLKRKTPRRKVRQRQGASALKLSYP